MTQSQSTVPRFPEPSDAEAFESARSPSAMLVERYFDLWNAGNGALADDVLGPTYLDHAHPDFVGPAAVRSLVPRFRAADPSAHWTIGVVAADAEYVAVRTSLKRTRDGEVVDASGVALFRVADGKLAEQWSWLQGDAVPRATIAWITEWFRDWKSPLAQAAREVFIPFVDEGRQ